MMIIIMMEVKEGAGMKKQDPPPAAASDDSGIRNPRLARGIWAPEPDLPLRGWSKLKIQLKYDWLKGDVDHARVRSGANIGAKY